MDSTAPKLPLNIVVKILRDKGYLSEHSRMVQYQQIVTVAGVYCTVY